MSAATQSVPAYCTLITKSRLLTPEQVKEAYRSWQETLGGAEPETESLRKFLVSRKQLTDYQSRLLMRGHSDGYFLDNYKILDLLSKGSQTGTYKAVHSSGQVVAIKVLPPSKAKDPTVLSRFQREGRLLTKLDHPNVVRAFQLGQAGGRHYLVMEYFDSESLDEVLDRRKRLTPPEAVRIVHQVLQGLQHVFEKGMVHRDLKPENLVLVPPPAKGATETTFGCTVKIIDLGLGRTTFDESKNGDETPLTIEGSLLGSANYVAPEQARNAHEADIRSDIYSVGCVLYHLITGQVPFPESNVLAQIVKHATENARPLNQLVPGIPDALQQVVNWMMAKDPNQRYPTPAIAAQALQTFLQPTQEGPAIARPLPAYLKYLESTAEFDPVKAAAAAPIPDWAAGHIAPPPPPPPPPPAPAIPTGRIEDPKRKAAVKKDGTGQRPKLPAAPAPTVDLTAGSEDYDVEIVGVAPPSSVPAPTVEPLAPAKPKSTDDDEERSLLELDRRDYIMASAGGGIVAFAILMGYGVSRLLRGSSSSTAGTSQTEPTTQQERFVPPPRKVPEKVPEKPPEEPKEEMKKEEPKEEMKKEEPKEEMKKEEPKEEGK